MEPLEEPGRHAARPLGLPALKALSHPLRLQLLEMLSRYGAQTASGLAERLGESSGSTSYHLRQLAKHSLVREVPDKGNGRERWWERPPGPITVGPESRQGDPATISAARIVARQFGQNRAQALEDFLRFGDETLGEEWMDASVLNTSNLRVSREQLAEISDRVVAYLGDIVEEYRDAGGPDALPVQMHFNAFPLVDPGHPGTAGSTHQEKTT
ncbi:MAG TPA: helix-turn-helix domain-containing protein [Arthrobacter sp.]|nr:helix-turn-helix domain-containing protein [Arthrobacter sp.]